MNISAAFPDFHISASGTTSQPVAPAKAPRLIPNFLNPHIKSAGKICWVFSWGIFHICPCYIPLFPSQSFLGNNSHPLLFHPLPIPHNTTIYSSHANRQPSSENWNLLSFSWGKSASGFLLQQELKLNRGSCSSQDPTWSSPTLVLEHVTLLPSTLCAHCPSAPWISGIYSDLSDLSSTGSSDFISELISSEWPSLTLLSKSHLVCLATTPLSYGPPVWHVPLTDVTAFSYLVTHLWSSCLSLMCWLQESRDWIFFICCCILSA